MRKLKLITLFLFVICGIVFSACEKSPLPLINEDKDKPKEEEPEEKPLKGYDKTYLYYNDDKLLMGKLFYFLVALENNEAKNNIIENNDLNIVKGKYDKIFNEFSWTKYKNLPALGEELLLKSEDILLVQKELEALSSSTNFVKLIDEHIRPSGKYEHYSDLNNQYLVRQIWKESISKGINTIIEQYLIGVVPKYESDGLKYSLSSSEYMQQIGTQIDLLNKKTESNLFYSKLVEFCIKLLEINERNEAVRFEPLSSGENRNAYDNLRNINWKDYPYASILLLGDSPNSAGDAENISESAKTRIQYAVNAYKAKLAPVIIISGANIYPYQTQYFEAIEMKKWMVENHGISDKHIIAEPVARHTTTNLRNGSRLIFKYNIPSDKKSLIVTTKTQNDIIAEESFKQRCINELGYMPVILGDRLSNERFEFTPLVVSLHTNTTDPLDP